MLDQEEQGRGQEVSELCAPQRVPGELLLDTRLIDRTIAELEHIRIQHGLHKTVAIGRCLLRNFFAGDREAYRSKNRRHRSFRELAKRRDLPFSASTLRVSIAVTVQLEQIPDEIGWQLSVSHHRALLPITDPELKTELARKAIMNRISVRDLEAEVSELVADEPKKNRGGRPRLPEVVKRFRRMTNTLAPVAFDEGDARLLCASFGPEELEEIRERIEAHLELVRTALSVHVHTEGPAEA